MTSFLEEIPNIYKRFNETTTDTALRNMQKILKRIIKKQNLEIFDDDLNSIESKMHLVTSCEEGLENEDFNTKPENKHLFGKDAVNYLFWKLVNTANEDNTGCNAKQLYEFLEQNPNILMAALRGTFLDKDVINKHKKLEKEGKYIQDCYMEILQNLKKSLPTA